MTEKPHALQEYEDAHDRMMDAERWQYDERGRPITVTTKSPATTP